jgi:hypothetical protein
LLSQDANDDSRHDHHHEDRNNGEIPPQTAKTTAHALGKRPQEDDQCNEGKKTHVDKDAFGCAEMELALVDDCKAVIHQETVPKMAKEKQETDQRQPQGSV